MAEKKTRVMTPKRFAMSKFSGKATAESFLDTHMSFLKTQDYLTDILTAYENNEILPTPTVQACQSACLSHALESDVSVAKAKISNNLSKPTVIRRTADGKEVKTASPNARYTVTLMCKVMGENGSFHMEVGTVSKSKTKEVEKDGKVVTVTTNHLEDAIFGADSYNAAARLADRRLFEREDAVYAVVENTEGKPIKTKIKRDDAIARTLPRKKGPAARNRGTSTKTLGFGVKASNDRSSFSRG